MLQLSRVNIAQENQKGFISYLAIRQKFVHVILWFTLLLTGSLLSLEKVIEEVTPGSQNASMNADRDVLNNNISITIIGSGIRKKPLQTRAEFAKADDIKAMPRLRGTRTRWVVADRVIG